MGLHCTLPSVGSGPVGVWSPRTWTAGPWFCASGADVSFFPDGAPLSAIGGTAVLCSARHVHHAGWMGSVRILTDTDKSLLQPSAMHVCLSEMADHLQRKNNGTATGVQQCARVGMLPLPCFFFFSESEVLVCLAVRKTYRPSGVKEGPRVLDHFVKPAGAYSVTINNKVHYSPAAADCSVLRNLLLQYFSPLKKQGKSFVEGAPPTETHLVVRVVASIP